MSDVKLQERAIKAGMHYLELKGFEDVERFDDCITFRDGGTLVIAGVKVNEYGADFRPMVPDRAEYERKGVAYLMEHGESVDMPLRFDEIELVMCGEDRAMLRHAINCLA